MNKDTRGTIDCRENWLKESLFTCVPVLLYLWELYIYGVYMFKLEQNYVVVP